MNTKTLLALLFILIPCMPSSYSQVYEYYDLKPVEKGGKYGYDIYYNDNPDQILIDYKYEEAGLFYSPGLAKVKMNGKYGFINSSGEVVIDFQYDDACSFTGEYASVKKDGLWGFISTDGSQVIDFRYEMAFSFTEGSAPVMHNGKFGYIDKAGNPLTGFMFDKVNSFFELTALVMINNEVYRIEKDKYLLQEVQGYGEYAFLVGDEIAAVSDASYFKGIENETGYKGYNEVAANLGSDPDYSTFIETGNNTENEITAASGGGRWSLYTSIDGNITSSVAYDDLKHYSEGLIAVKLGDRWRFIDRYGKEVMGLKYEDAGYFSGGLANVQSEGRWGYIDRNDSYNIPPQYEYAAPFKDRYAWVVEGNKIVPVNREGQSLKAEILQQVFTFREGLAAVNVNGKMGYIDASGKKIIEPQYTYAGDFHDGRACVYDDGWYLYINREGKPAFDARYNLATDFSQGGAIVSSEYRPDQDNSDDLPLITYSIIDTLGRIMSDHLFTGIRRFNEGLVAACPSAMSSFNEIYWEGIKWGYFNSQGIEIIPIQFEGAGDFHNDCAVVKQEGEYFFIDHTGEQISDSFLEMTDMGQHILAGKVSGDGEIIEYAFIGRCGRVLSDWYRSVSGFRNGLTIVNKNDYAWRPMYWLMNDSFQVISSFYEELSVYNDYLFMARMHDDNYYDSYTFLDKTGQPTCPWLVGAPEQFSTGHVMVMGGNTETGETVYAIVSIVTGKMTSEWYNFIGPFNEGLAIVELSNPQEGLEYGYAVIDETGKRLSEWTEGMEEVRDGFALLVFPEGYRLVTGTGATVKEKYMGLYDITEGVALYETEKYFKYADLKGNIFSSKWVDAYPFSEGMAAVRQKKTGYGYINSTGELVIPYQFIEAGKFAEGLAAVADDSGLYGYIDKSGRLVIGCHFHSAGDFYEGSAYVTRDMESFIIDRTGNRIE